MPRKRLFACVLDWFAIVWRNAKKRAAKNPHKSFRLTDKYAKKKRPLKLPKYIAFTGEVLRSIRVNGKSFGWLIAVVAVVQIVMVGLLSTETITSFQEALKETSGDVSAVTSAGMTLVKTISTGGLDLEANENGNFVRVLTWVIVWLATVVILRQWLAGNKIKMRDALYTCGTPIASSFGILLVMVLQALPILLGLLLYNAAVATNFLKTPMTGICFWVFAGALILFSVYWLVQSLLALIVATLNGTYPINALHIAGDMIRGRRVRFILRVLWMVLVMAVITVIVMIPLIMLFAWLGGVWPWLNNVPILPVILVFIMCFAVVFISSYMYLLYRKILEQDHYAKK
jgi:hypothetical protein